MHTIETIQKVEFKQTTPNMFTFGFVNADTWFKLTIANQSDTNQLIFQLVEPFFQRIYFYSQKEGKWRKQHSGLFYYHLENNPNYLTPIFGFEIASGGVESIYLHLAPDTGGLSFGRFLLATQSSFNANVIFGEYLFYFVFFGTMLLVIVFYLFLSIKFYESIYLYYSLYAFFCLSILVSIRVSYTIWVWRGGITNSPLVFHFFWFF